MPLSAQDWLPRGGRMFIPCLVLVYTLIAAGALIRQEMYFFGAAALTAGLALGVLIVLYVLRPIPIALHADLFPIERPGYLFTDVDNYLKARSVNGTISPPPVFRVAARGYRTGAVDDALAWRESVNESD